MSNIVIGVSQNSVQDNEALRAALVRLLWRSVADDSECTCSPGATCPECDTCPECQAMAALGLGRWTGAVDATARLTSSVNMSARANLWLDYGETGLSSLTIWAVMMGQYCGEPRPPRDPDDFRRCHRLLERIPEWRPRLAEVATAYPEWRGLVEHWDELTAMLLADEAKGSSRRMYRLMRTLLHREAIRALRENGRSDVDIAIALGMSAAQVRRIAGARSKRIPNGFQTDSKAGANE